MSDVSNAGTLACPADGITKGDVVAHYRTVADVLVPHPRRTRRRPARERGPRHDIHADAASAAREPEKLS